MLFVAIVKGEVSLISFSAHLSSVYRRATDCFELILYPATLLGVFMSCRSSLVIFGVAYVNYHIITNNENLTSLYLLKLLLLSYCSG